jgi:hypothetical protein
MPGYQQTLQTTHSTMPGYLCRPSRPLQMSCQATNRPFRPPIVPCQATYRPSRPLSSTVPDYPPPLTVTGAVVERVESFKSTPKSHRDCIFWSNSRAPVHNERTCCAFTRQLYGRYTCPDRVARVASETSNANNPPTDQMILDELPVTANKLWTNIEHWTALFSRLLSVLLPLSFRLLLSVICWIKPLCCIFAINPYNYIITHSTMPGIATTKKLLYNFTYCFYLLTYWLDTCVRIDFESPTIRDAYNTS